MNLYDKDTFLSLVIENMSDGLCVCHNIEEFPYVRFTIWNKKMSKLTGYTIEEINRSGWYQTIYPDPDIRLKAIKRMETMRHGDDLHAEEWEITRADGQKRCFSISTSIIYDADKATHVMALMRDITERRRAEKALQTSEAELRAIFENSAAGVTVSDLNGKILQTNPAHQKMFGYDSDELETMLFSDFTYPDDIGKHRTTYDSLISGEIDHFNMRKRFFHRNGRVVWTQVTVSLVRDKNKTPLFVVGIVEDITERKQVEDEKEKLIAELQKALEEIKILRGIIPICSHCKQIRDDKGFWNKVENYIEQHTGAQFSHGVCPDCLREYYPEIYCKKK